jgi:hypothetical protein
MRHAMFAAISLLGQALAQEPGPDAMASARTRLQKALSTMAALPSCAFESSWGPDQDAKAKDGGAAHVVLVGGGPATTTEPGTATGCYADGILHLTSRDNAVAFANRRMIAKSDDGWVVRRGKLADGSALSFVPDPQVLFDLLQDWQMAVTHREVGTLADKPVEILSVTLNDDQVAEAFWSGLLPENVGGLGGLTVLRGGAAMFVGGGGAKAGPPKPSATVDLAFFVDPATGHLHEVRARTWSSADQAMAAMGFAGFRAGRVVAGGGGDDEQDEEEEAPEAGKAADGKTEELQYKDGLPVRPRKKMQVTDYTLKFREHGTAKLPELDAAARTLLGLR